MAKKKVKKPTQKEFLKELERVSKVKAIKKTKKPTQKEILRELESISGVDLSKKIPKSKKPTQKEFLKEFEKLSGVSFNKNAVYQRIYRLQNKLDKKGISSKEKKEIEKSLSKEKASIGYEGLTTRESSRFSKEKKSLTSRQVDLLKKFKDKRTSKKNKNKIAKELMQISSRLKEVNLKLGAKGKKPRKKKVPKKKKGEIISEVPGWVVKPDYLDPAIKTGFFKLYIIDGESISKSKPDKIYDVWQELYARLLLNGSNGKAIIIESSKDRTMQIDERP